MNTTEHILQCAYRQGYVDHFKWQLVPIVGAGSSASIAVTITALALASLFSYDLTLNNKLRISEKKHDLTVLFLNAVANILTVGILNAVLIPACARNMESSFETKPCSNVELDSNSDSDSEDATTIADEDSECYSESSSEIGDFINLDQVCDSEAEEGVDTEEII